MSETIVFAQLEVRRCRAELWLNGVPILFGRDDPHSLTTINVAAEHWITSGHNSIELLVEPGASPTAARFGETTIAVGASAAARLIRLPPGVEAVAQNGTLLLSATYRQQHDDEVGPRSIVEVGSFQAQVGRWGFQDAPPLTPGPALVDEAEAVLSQIDEAYGRADGGRLYEILRHHQEDVVRAYPAISEQSLRDDLDATARHIARSRPPTQPRIAEHRDYRLVADGRLLQCVNRDYHPALQLIDPDQYVAMPVPIYLGRVDGALRVLR